MTSILTITDENYRRITDPSVPGNGPCGALPRKTAFGAAPSAQAADFPLIPWEEVPDRIADQERNKSSIYHIWEDNGGWCLDQNPLSYCWSFSVVTNMMLNRAIQGLPFVHLSPSSIACPITNWSNEAGYIETALRYACQHGVASTDFVPETTMDRRQFKDGWQEDAAKYKPTLWEDLNPNIPQQIVTSVLTTKPVTVQLPWWGHAITYGRLIDKYPKLPANRWDRYAPWALNTWKGTWGMRGWCELVGSRWIPNCAFRMRQVSARF